MPKETKNTDRKTLAVLSHILTFVGGFVAPLVIMLISEDEYVKKHAKRSLNWQISSAIYLVISFVLMLILVGFIFIGILAILDLVFVIIASVKASKNELWDYPLSIKFLKD